MRTEPAWNDYLQQAAAAAWGAERAAALQPGLRRLAAGLARIEAHPPSGETVPESASVLGRKLDGNG